MIKAMKTLKTMMKEGRVILSAHRGDRVRCPENTMPAFLSAERLGADMIETDLHMTRDGVLVIIHDRNPKRTCGVDGLIDRMTIDEVRTLDAGALFDPSFAGTPVSTVEEFLQWLQGNEMFVNWELKDFPHEVGDAHAFATADRLIALLDQYGMSERSMINSFSARVLEHVKKNYGDRYLIHGQGIASKIRSIDTPECSFEELFDWCNLYAVEKGHSVVEYPENFEHCLAHGILPCLCIPENEEIFRRAIELGCKMFTANDVVVADDILRRLGAR